MCVRALKQKKTKLTAGNTEDAFVSKAFFNWNGAASESTIPAIATKKL